MDNYALLFNIGLLNLYLDCRIMFILCIYQISILLCPLARQLSKDVHQMQAFRAVKVRCSAQV